MVTTQFQTLISSGAVLLMAAATTPMGFITALTLALLLIRLRSRGVDTSTLWFSARVMRTTVPPQHRFQVVVETYVRMLPETHFWQTDNHTRACEEIASRYIVRAFRLARALRLHKVGIRREERRNNNFIFALTEVEADVYRAKHADPVVYAGPQWPLDRRDEPNQRHSDLDEQDVDNDAVDAGSDIQIQMTELRAINALQESLMSSLGGYKPHTKANRICVLKRANDLYDDVVKGQPHMNRRSTVNKACKLYFHNSALDAASWDAFTEDHPFEAAI